MELCSFYHLKPAIRNQNFRNFYSPSWRGFANRAMPYKGKEFFAFSKHDTGRRPAPAGVEFRTNGKTITLYGGFTVNAGGIFKLNTN